MPKKAEPATQATERQVDLLGMPVEEAPKARMRSQEESQICKMREVYSRLRKRFPRDLHKEHWREGEVDKDKKKRGPKRTKTPEPKLESTLYKWWWEFQKAAQDFPKVREEIMAKSEAHADAMGKNDYYFGDLEEDFLRWWASGRNWIFKEKEIPLLEVIGPTRPYDPEIRKPYVVVKIPLTISRELIHKQIDEVLAVYHPGDKLKRHKYSTAARPIYSEHRYRTTNFRFLISVWRLKQAALQRDDEDSWWKIYCDAMGNANLKTRLGKNTADSASVKVRYAKRAKEAYEQASELIRNALIGEFPKDDTYQAKKQRKTKSA